MPTIFIPTPMRRSTNNQASVYAIPGTLKSALNSLAYDYPLLVPQLYESGGGIKKYINIFVNGDEIHTLQGLETLIEDRDEVFIVPAMAGG